LLKESYRTNTVLLIFK